MCCRASVAPKRSARSKLIILVVSALTLVMYLLSYWSIIPAAAQAPTEWTPPRPISSNTEHGWEPTLVADARGVVHAFWSGRPIDQEAEPRAIMYARYQDGQWSQPIDIMLSPDGQDALFPRAIVDSDGRMHLLWSAPGEGPFGPLYHSWAPVQDVMSAQSWQAPHQLADGTYQSDVEMDPKGHLHVVYASVRDKTGICHISSQNNGDTWGDKSCVPHVEGIRDQENEVRPRLAIDSIGNLHAVWVLDDYSPFSVFGYSGRGVYYARSTDGGTTWSDPVVVEEADSRDEAFTGSQPEWGYVAVDGKDRVHVVWIGTTNMWRYHQWSGDSGATWSSPQVVIPAGGYNNWQAMMVDGDGMLHLVWPSLGGLKYTWWNGNKWAPVISIPGEVGNAHHAQAAVALGSELHIVWQNHDGLLEASNGPRLILHTMKLTRAERKEPQPLPFAYPGPRLAVETTSPRSRELTAVPTVGLANTRSRYKVEAGNGTPVLLGLAPSLVLVLVVVFFRVRRR